MIVDVDQLDEGRRAIVEDLADTEVHWFGQGLGAAAVFDLESAQRHAVDSAGLRGVEDEDGVEISGSDDGGGAREGPAVVSAFHRELVCRVTLDFQFSGIGGAGGSGAGTERGARDGGAPAGGQWVVAIGVACMQAGGSSVCGSPHHAIAA